MIKSGIGFKAFRGVYAVLDNVVNSGETVFIAYSGGKDSTALAILLYDWILDRKRDLKVVLANSDTLSEIPVMREWTIDFMKRYVDKLRKIGIDASYRVYTPKPEDTFYWRVLVKGYSAPTFNFRWCVELLKRKPAREITSIENSILLLGHRDEESRTRARTLSSRTAHYLQIEGSVRKAYPIRELKEKDVWKYLESKRREFGLDKLFELYLNGNMKARYGCWHCTLVKKQLAHYLLGGKYLYLEALRKIYKAISDNPELRALKNHGYSRLGYLLTEARSILLYSFKAVEKLTDMKLYGLDEARIGEYSLREIFYKLESSEADKIVFEKEKHSRDKNRLAKIEELRNPPRNITQILDKLKTLVENTDIKNYTINLLNEIEKLIG
ncbi:MAG: phosphoadenosine phosphosulfate reductase family protein [Thermosphaera sp.]